MPCVYSSRAIISKVDEALSECYQTYPSEAVDKAIGQQIKVLREMICLEDENVLTRKRICETLERIFASKSASTVSTHIFGSSINGLGLKGCDLDVYVDVPGNPKSFENGSQGMSVFGFGCFHDEYLKFLFLSRYT